VKHLLIAALYSPIFCRFIQLVLITTVLITTLLFVKYADKPSRKLYGDVDYTQLKPFNITAVIENGDAAVWDPQSGLLGLNGDGEDLQKREYSVFLEMHAHTTHSDGDLTPEQSTFCLKGMPGYIVDSYKLTVADHSCRLGPRLRLQCPRHQ